jgi:hypothetical protein
MSLFATHPDAIAGTRQPNCSISVTDEHEEGTKHALGQHAQC